MTDSIVLDRPADGGAIPWASLRDAVLSALVVAVAAVVLAAPALWNGYPLLYWDSADYMTMPFTGEVPAFRTVSYTIISVFGALSGTLWTPVALQCLLVAWLLHETLAAFAPERVRVALVPVACGLTVFTALPWFTGQIMADTFTGVLVLGLAALAFGRRAGTVRRSLLVAGLAVAVAVHTSHIAVAAGLVLVFATLRGLALFRRWRWISADVGLPAAALAVGIVLAVAANAALTGRVFVSQSTNNLMLARLVQDGIAKRYLDTVCPKGEALRLCKYRKHLPGTANAFLWFPGPFYELGGWASPAVKKEAQLIVSDSLRLFPWEHVKAAADLTLEQLFMVDTGDGVVKLDTIHAGDSVEKNPFIPKILRKYYPGDLPAYWASGQRAGIDFGWINAVQVPLVFLGYLALPVVMVLAWRRRDRLAAGLALVVLLGLLGNAFVCGALSNPNHRYQARIAWTALFAVGIGAVRLRRPDAAVPA